MTNLPRTEHRLHGCRCPATRELIVLGPHIKLRPQWLATLAGRHDAYEILFSISSLSTEFESCYKTTKTSMSSPHKLKRMYFHLWTIQVRCVGQTWFPVSTTIQRIGLEWLKITKYDMTNMSYSRSAFQFVYEDSWPPKIDLRLTVFGVSPPRSFHFLSDSKIFFLPIFRLEYFPLHRVRTRWLDQSLRNFGGQPPKHVL